MGELLKKEFIKYYDFNITYLVLRLREEVAYHNSFNTFNIKTIY